MQAHKFDDIYSSTSISSEIKIVLNRYDSAADNSKYNSTPAPALTDIRSDKQIFQFLKRIKFYQEPQTVLYWHLSYAYSYTFFL